LQVQTCNPEWPVSYASKSCRDRQESRTWNLTRIVPVVIAAHCLIILSPTEEDMLAVISEDKLDAALDAAASIMNANFVTGGIRSVCLYWAKAVVLGFETQGERAVIQAGTCFWPRLSDINADGALFGRVWEGLEAAIDHVDRRVMPTMHVWTALPEYDLIVDLSAQYLPRQCREHGLAWSAPEPPTVFVGGPEDCRRQHAVYEPFEDAARVAMAMLEFSPWGGQGGDPGSLRRLRYLMAESGAGRNDPIGSR
jgi:hypothetical protein